MRIFKSYLDAARHCVKHGIDPARIKRISLREYRIVKAATS